MSAFTEADWARLATLFDGVPRNHVCGLRGFVDSGDECPGCGANEPYAGYRPEVKEAPNGDTKACERCDGAGRIPTSSGSGSSACGGCNGSGRVPNVDASKRYLHVAEKCLTQHPGLDWPREYLARAHYEACRVATALAVPAAYRPHEAFGALRVLDYPPGAGTVEHTDFDLLSIVLWRSTPDDLQFGADGSGKAIPIGRVQVVRDTLSPGLHIGEIGELAGLGPATPHRVLARPYRQKSLIYFAIPDRAAMLHLPTHHVCERGETCVDAGCTVGPVTVGAWLAERIARSRYA